VYRIIVHHLSRVTEKERRYVCTLDEQRKNHVDKVGTIHGDLWSEVRNIHSRQVYLILTQPVLGSDAWVTYLFALVHKKTLLGLLTFRQWILIVPSSRSGARIKQRLLPCMHRYEVL
jgi:hypothetical protein